MNRVRNVVAAFAVVALGLLTACAAPEEAATTEETASAPSSVVVYSGRNEALIGPLLDRFQEETGTDVEVRYASTSELTATLLEEGASTPADLFISQDAAALGALAKQGMLKKLPADLVERVPARFASSTGEWVGLSGRARSVVYNPERISEDELPKSLEELSDPRYAGRFGLAPANGSFQAHMAVYSAVGGADALAELLAGIAGNEPSFYPKNGAIVEATIRGEVDFGLVNHYYLLRALAEDPAASGRNFFMSEGAASGFVNLAGAGVLSDSEQAIELIRFMLSTESQQYFASETYEYPLIDGVAPAMELKPLDELATPEVEFGQVSEVLPEALAAISESGLLR